MQVLSEAVRATGRDRAAAAARGLTRSSVIWAVSLAALVFTAVACTTSRLLMLSLVTFCHPVLLAEYLKNGGDLEADAGTSVRFLLRAITPRA